jgi:predicted CopG family antitoxin
MHRTQILIESEQHQALTEIAQRERKSLSAVVREMLQVQLERRRQDATAVQERRLQALERIRHHRQLILDRRGGKPLESDVVEFINQIRDERDGEITGDIHDHS